MANQCSLWFVRNHWKFCFLTILIKLPGPWLTSCGGKVIGQASGFRDGLILHTCEREGPCHWQYQKVVAKPHFTGHAWIGAQTYIFVVCMSGWSTYYVCVGMCILFKKCTSPELVAHLRIKCVCMYACMYACMYVCMHVCMDSVVRMSPGCGPIQFCQAQYACMYVCMYASCCTHVSRMWPHPILSSAVCLYVCMHVCMHLVVCMSPGCGPIQFCQAQYACMFVCMYLVVCMSPGARVDRIPVLVHQIKIYWNSKMCIITCMHECICIHI